MAKKTLNTKQRKALELLTCGEGLTYKEVAEQAGVNPKTLWDWRHLPEYTHFQEELDKINEQRWAATVDAARAAAVRLCKADNAKFVEFVLKNEGYNPTTKLDADLHTDIEINIEE